MKNETRVTASGARVICYNIASTTVYVLAAYEPSGSSPYRHSTIRHFDDAPGTWGRIGTSVLPDSVASADLAARIAYINADDARAIATIRAAFPEVVGIERDGEIEVSV